MTIVEPKGRLRSPRSGDLGKPRRRFTLWPKEIPVPIQIPSPAPVPTPVEEPDRVEVTP